MKKTFLPAAGLSIGLALAHSAAGAPPTADEARAFVESADARLLKIAIDADRASWVYATFITDDTEALAALLGEKRTALGVELAKEASRFDGVKAAPDVARKLELLKKSLVIASPANTPESEELARLLAQMEGTYGKGKATLPGKAQPLDLGQLEDILAQSRDPKVLLEAWKGWHDAFAAQRRDYLRYVALANKGAKELGFADTGALWRAKYDMEPDAFAKECDRLWEQVKPLYLSLHAYVRNRLRETYGDAVVPAKGPIPAHLLGNMWAQTWDNLYPILAPKDADPGYDLNAILKAKKVDELGMVRYGEGFFTSLGFPALPKTFWERSLFVKPRDREVVCHASAWDLDQVDDLRVKMCIKINAEDFSTIHHELGHNFYQRAYNKQPFLFRDGAHDGFHEAIGDTIALSITPSYLKQLGFIDKEPPASKDLGLLLKMALEKVSFLPFGLMIDKWRWQVFSGQIPPEKLNESWWEIRRQYQGIAPAVARSEKDFDPFAKYHIASSTPYMRYFLADILQFQLHRSLAKAAGCTGPLNRCSIYGNKAAGEKLAAMLEMGQSRPWPDALEKVTGQRQMDASAIVDYFAPLKKWLDEQNAGKPVGW